VLVSVNVPPEMSGFVLTKVGAVPVHGDTIWKPTAGFSMMLLDEKNRYVPSGTDAAGSTDTIEGGVSGIAPTAGLVQVSMMMPGCVATLARMRLPNLPPVASRMRIIALLLPRFERAPAPTRVMP
jgi:hypothetical protein